MFIYEIAFIAATRQYTFCSERCVLSIQFLFCLAPENTFESKQKNINKFIWSLSSHEFFSIKMKTLKGYTLSCHRLKHLQFLLFIVLKTKSRVNRGSKFHCLLFCFFLFTFVVPKIWSIIINNRACVVSLRKAKNFALNVCNVCDDFFVDIDAGQVGLRWQVFIVIVQ